MNKLKAQAEAQRKKIKTLKQNQDLVAEVTEEKPAPAPKAVKPVKLTTENLRKNDEIISRQESRKEKRSPTKPKPVWAKTEDQLKKDE